MSEMNEILTKERWEELINGKLYSTCMQDGFMYLFKTDDTPKRIYLHLAYYFFPTEEIEIKNRDFQAAKEEIAKHIETYYMEMGKNYASRLKNEMFLDKKLEYSMPSIEDVSEETQSVSDVDNAKQSGMSR